MCGISGIISKSTVDRTFIEKMTDIISYRGPDDFGYLAYNSVEKSAYAFKEQFSNSKDYNIYLGHRRLSILDLSSTGHQPMTYLDERYWITYNGEIYNYLELRDELKKAGFIFRSNTDTEVILASYHYWRNDCLLYFNGMFSFAILDTKENTVFCARDRLGIKPFYYAYSEGHFIFASELKQIISLPIFRFNQDFKTLTNYFFSGSYNSVGEGTFFEGVKELRGGHFFELKLNNPEIQNFQIVKYWDINLKNKIRYHSTEEYSQHYLELFKDSIKLRLRSDVPVGSALSGGLDSSGIVCIVADLLKEQNVKGMQKTFTAISDIEGFDESEYAKAVIEHTQAEPFYTLPSANTLISDYQDLIWHQEEPFISTSIFAGWCVSKLVRESGVVVSLDGQGPDEMLGGYYPYVAVLLQDLTSCSFNSFSTNYKYYKEILGIKDRSMLYSFLAKLKPNFIPVSLFKSYYNTKKRLFKEDVWEDEISKNIKKETFSYYTLKAFDKYSYEATRLKPLPGILKQVDRNSMAFSVESRVPFLDHRLVEYSFSIPINQKVNGVSKLVYRNALKNYLPNKINNRKTKLGFVTAESTWLKTEELKKIFIDVYGSIDNNSIINKDEIINRYKHFCEGKGPFESMFWKVFNYQVWLNSFNKLN